jgi:hypothetical protein
MANTSALPIFIPNAHPDIALIVGLEAHVALLSGCDRHLLPCI